MPRLRQHSGVRQRRLCLPRGQEPLRSVRLRRLHLGRHELRRMRHGVSHDDALLRELDVHLELPDGHSGLRRRLRKLDDRREQLRRLQQALRRWPDLLGRCLHGRR